jgi:hypothetical protein
MGELARIALRTTDNQHDNRTGGIFEAWRNNSMSITKDNALIFGAVAAAGILIYLAWRSSNDNSVPGLGVFGIDWHYGSNFEIVKGGYVANDNIGDAAFWAELGL